VAVQDPVLDAAGDRVAWETAAPIGGAPDDRNAHIFVRDLKTFETRFVSRADGPDGAPANASAVDPSIDAAGDAVAFTSMATNLGTPPGAVSVFVRDVDSGHTQIVSVGADGKPLRFGNGPSIDAAGDRIAFGTNDGFDQFEVLVRDRVAGTTELGSRADGPDGAPSDADVSQWSLTPSGDCLAFDGRATNLNDGFSTPDFSAVHMRVLRGDCGPVPFPEAPGPGGPLAPPAGPPPPVGHGPGTPKAAKPVLAKLKVTPSSFWTSGHGRGTTIRFTLSKAATVRIRVDRIAGHKARRIGSITVKGRRGSNHVKFSGRVGHKTLSRASYRLTAVPTSGRGHSARFRVIKAPKTHSRAKSQGPRLIVRGPVPPHGRRR
jgi:hypothetical protein